MTTGAETTREAGDAGRLRVLLAKMPEVEADGVLLVGGAAADAAALAGLLEWLMARGGGDARWWRCLEWTDRARLEEATPTLPDDLERLTWGRWFGEAADLEAWRAGEGFRWRLVAGPGKEPPGTDTRFFHVEPGEEAPVLRRGEEVTAYLWGADEGQVATADAATRALLLRFQGRARLRYVPFYDRGALAAVWYRGIDGNEVGAGAATGSV